MPDLYLIVLVYRNTSLNLLESMRSVDTAYDARDKAEEQ